MCGFINRPAPIRVGSSFKEATMPWTKRRGIYYLYTMTYLSIDLDYWCQRKSALPPDAFFDKVLGLKLPICLAPLHHQLLDHINNSGCRHLINVDAHSDLSNTKAVKWRLNEGTWVNYVKWKKRGTFEWRYPLIHYWPHDGFCHWDKNPFTNEFRTGWKKASYADGLNHLPWDSITAIGIVPSFHYCFYNHIDEIATRLGIVDWKHKNLTELENVSPYMRAF